MKRLVLSAALIVGAVALTVAPTPKAEAGTIIPGAVATDWLAASEGVSKVHYRSYRHCHWRYRTRCGYRRVRHCWYSYGYRRCGWRPVRRCWKVRYGRYCHGGYSGY